MQSTIFQVHSVLIVHFLFPNPAFQGLIDVFVNDNPVEDLLSDLNILQGFGAKLDGDIGGITRLLSDKACGDLNSAIDDITSLANANKLLNGILSNRGGILPALEGITGIKNGLESKDNECFGAVSSQVSEQMNTFLGRSPTRRKLLLLGVVDGIVGNASNSTNSLLDQTNSLNNILSNLTSSLEDASGNTLLSDLISNFTSLVEDIGDHPPLTDFLSNLTRVVGSATGNTSIDDLLPNLNSLVENIGDNTTLNGLRSDLTGDVTSNVNLDGLLANLTDVVTDVAGKYFLLFDQ